MTLLSHPQVLEAFGPLMPCSDKAEGEHRLCCNGMCEAARPYVENAITAILTALQAGEGLDFTGIDPDIAVVGWATLQRLDRQHKARVGALREVLLAVGIGYIDGEGWYYTCEPHGEVPSEDGSLLAALRATMALKDEVPAPQMPDKYEETLVAYRKVNSELTEEVSALRQEIATLRADIADVKAKEECRPHAISSTSLRNAVQHLYRHLGGTS